VPGAARAALLGTDSYIQWASASVVHWKYAHICTYCLVRRHMHAGVHFCHKHGVAHRDLKLENTLLKHEVTQPGASPIPVLKIADFGFCKHELMHTPPDSRVGTPAYISPVRSQPVQSTMTPPPCFLMHACCADAAMLYHLVLLCDACSSCMTIASERSQERLATI
jgi:hypothetical protein